MLHAILATCSDFIKHIPCIAVLGNTAVLAQRPSMHTLLVRWLSVNVLTILHNPLLLFHDRNKLCTATLSDQIFSQYHNKSMEFKWFMTMHWWFIMQQKTNKCIYRHVNLMYYKQRSLLHVSATYCGHFQGGVLWRIYYTECQNSILV